jgi:hypothetical protein
LLQLSSASFRDEKARGRWGADFVAVVSWYAEPLSWLTRLPLGPLRLAVYAKHPQSRCADLPPLAQTHVALCQEHVFNSAGREVHTWLTFVVEHYKLLVRPAAVAFELL